MFTADILRRLVTLTFDSLTLNAFNVSMVAWPNSVENSSEIEQSAAELLRFEHVQFVRRYATLDTARREFSIFGPEDPQPIKF